MIKVLRKNILSFQKLDKALILSPGLKKILGTKNNKMSRFEIMHRLIEKMHFLRLHHILTKKNYKIPPSWQKALKYKQAYADEVELTKIISLNTL